MQFKESYRHSWIATVADDVQSICMFDLLKSEPIISPYQYNLFIKASVDKIRKLHFIHNDLLGDIIIASPVINNFLVEYANVQSIGATLFCKKFRIPTIQETLMKKQLMAAIFAVLTLSEAANAQTVKPLKLNRDGCIRSIAVRKGDRFRFDGEAGMRLYAQSTARFTVHNGNRGELQTQYEHDGETGEINPFIELDESGHYRLNIVHGGKIRFLCIR